MMSHPSGNTRYSGQTTPIFKLAFVTGFLTLITFGIYRFWAKTRLRKYIWSSVSIDGDAFEYTGTGLEKLLGFLIAIVFLAAYLAAIQLVLTFFGLGFIFAEKNEIGIVVSIYLSLVAVVPFLLFAIYRMRRYKLARTRLRGIRFGMESAAWGYALRAFGHYFLTLITFGILLPRQSFYLEKYMTDRSYYGDAQFQQGGRWQGLYAAMKHIFIGLGVMVVGGGVAAFMVPGIGLIMLFIGCFWFVIGFLYYRVHSYAYLANHKILGGKVTFTANPSTGEVLKTFILGGITISIAGLIGAVVMGGFVYGAVMMGSEGYNGATRVQATSIILPFAILYFFTLVGLGVLFVTLLTQPIIAHLVTSFHVNNVENLGTIRQRAHDKGADAEGFADALDIGGAI